MSEYQEERLKLWNDAVLAADTARIKVLADARIAYAEATAEAERAWRDEAARHFGWEKVG